MVMLLIAAWVGIHHTRICAGDEGFQQLIRQRAAILGDLHRHRIRAFVGQQNVPLAVAALIRLGINRLSDGRDPVRIHWHDGTICANGGREDRS